MHPAMLVLAAANTVEALCLSYLGQAQLLTYSTVLPLLLLLDAVGLGLGAGAASLYARATDPARGEIVGASLVWALAIGVVLAATLLLMCGSVASGEVKIYVRFWAPTIPLALLNFCAFALLRAADRCRLAARGIALGGALQTALVPAFVFGVGALPAMGIAGAALAHAVAAAAVSIGLVLLTKKDWPMGRAQTSRLLVTGRALLRLALPAALSNLAVPLGAALMMELLGNSHEGFVAAYALALRMEGFCLVAFYAYSSVVGPLAVEQRHGSFALLKNCRNHCLALGAGLAVLLAPLPLSFDYWLASCPNSILPLQLYFWIVPLSYGAYGFVMLANGMFNGWGRPYYSLCVSLLRCLVLLWPAAALLNHLLPGAGVYVAIAVTNGLSAAIAFFLLKRAHVPASDPIPTTTPFTRRFL